MDSRQELLNKTIKELIDAKHYIISTNKISKDLYIKEIDNVLILLRAGDKTLSGMYRAKNILKIIEILKNSRH